jgi:hypothetical protein
MVYIDNIEALPYNIVISVAQFLGGLCMKTSFYVELQEKKTDYKVLSNSAKEIWKSGGSKVKDLVSLELYYKPLEHKCYYVFNDDVSGSFEA